MRVGRKTKVSVLVTASAVQQTEPESQGLEQPGSCSPTAPPRAQADPWQQKSGRAAPPVHLGLHSSSVQEAQKLFSSVRRSCCLFKYSQ